MTRVKVCGLTRAADVRLAAELGAWALGFVLTQSPRQVSLTQAAELIAAAREAAGPDADGSGDGAARGLLTVAVVTTEAPASIAATLDACGADAVQLSAGADGPSVTDVRAAGARLRRRPLVIAAADTPDARRADLVLLDARTAGAYGGTGERLDWEALAVGLTTPRRQLVLAGGLRPGNVAEAVGLLRPLAVDVSSGVEAAPRRKDHALLRDFFAAVEQADTRAAAAAEVRDRAAGAAGHTPTTHLRRTAG